MPEEFYSAIMLAFGIWVGGHEDEVENDGEDEEEDEWVTETLAWWNGCVLYPASCLHFDTCVRKNFGTKPAATASPTVRGSTLQRLLAKCAAKKQARKTSAFTATPPTAAISSSALASLAAADDGDSTTLAGSSSPPPGTSIKACRMADKRKLVMSETELDNDEQGQEEEKLLQG